MSNFTSERLQKRHEQERQARQQTFKDLLTALALVVAVVVYHMIQAW